MTLAFTLAIWVTTNGGKTRYEHLHVTPPRILYRTVSQREMSKRGDCPRCVSDCIQIPPPSKAAARPGLVLSIAGCLPPSPPALCHTVPRAADGVSAGCQLPHHSLQGLSGRVVPGTRPFANRKMSRSSSNLEISQSCKPLPSPPSISISHPLFFSHTFVAGESVCGIQGVPVGSGDDNCRQKVKLSRWLAQNAGEV